MGLKALIVDDEPPARARLGALLRELDQVEVVGEAASGKDAMRLAIEHQPDVILMDIQMPDVNGIEATRLLKAHYPAMIVIGLSVNADGENETAMKKSGAHLLLTKEAAVEHLYVAIQRVVGRTEDVSADS